MNGVGGLSGWRWLFVFDGIITLPMALWGKLPTLKPKPSSVPALLHPENTDGMYTQPQHRILLAARSPQQYPRPLAQARGKGHGPRAHEARRQAARGALYVAWVEARPVQMALLGVHQLLYVST